MQRILATTLLLIACALGCADWRWQSPVRAPLTTDPDPEAVAAKAQQLEQRNTDLAAKVADAERKGCARYIYNPNAKQDEDLFVCAPAGTAEADSISSHDLFCFKQLEVAVGLANMKDEQALRAKIAQAIENGDDEQQALLSKLDASTAPDSESSQVLLIGLGTVGPCANNAKALARMLRYVNSGDKVRPEKPARAGTADTAVFTSGNP